MRSTGIKFGKFANRQLSEFILCLKPVINFMAGPAPAPHVKFVGVGANGGFRWTPASHDLIVPVQFCEAFSA